MSTSSSDEKKKQLGQQQTSTSSDKPTRGSDPSEGKFDISLGEGQEDPDHEEEEEESTLPEVSGISSGVYGSPTTQEKVPLCRRRRKKDKNAHARLDDIPEADEYEDEEEGDEGLELEGDAEHADISVPPSRQYEEYCGEGLEEDDEEGVPCRKRDDDWEYYYEPCDPTIDGAEEDEEEEEMEDEEAARAAKEREDADAEKAREMEEAQRIHDQEMEQEDEEEEEEYLAQRQEEDEELKTLFMGKMEPEIEVETLANIEGVVGLTLTPATKQFFEVNDEEMLGSKQQVHKWLSWKQVKMHIFMNGEESEFSPYYEQIKYYPDVTMLLGSDPRQDTGHDYFFCLTIEARNNVLNPAKRKRVAIDMKKKQEQIWNEMASKTPHKWKGFGSEIEVDEELVVDSRPLITMQVYGFRQRLGGSYNFEDAPPSNWLSASFKSEPADSYPSIQLMEVDRAIQVIPVQKDTSTQTRLSFKRNKMVQYSTQAMTEKNVATSMGSKAMVKFFKRVMPKLDKVLQQNEMVDLLHDDYRNLKCKRGHEMEFSKDSLLLQEYQTYSDFRHSKGRTVTCMIFHPILEDVVVMATATDLTWERRIDAHSKTLMDPNYVLFWDLRDSAHPQIMLDAPADVFSFQINPSDPNLVCGGCANGQIAFWDLGRVYFELRAKIQDRKTLSSDSKSKRPSFLEKLKDSAESLVCPLIPVTALSNLEMSHKRAVTSVAWLPPHIELGKNAMTYDSTTGRSTQFMSVAGDGTLRCWDIRPQKKLGQGDEDEDDVAKIIKVNKWAHLENNQWKYHFRFVLEDQAGNPMFATTFRICEKRQQPKDTKDEKSTSSGGDFSPPSSDKLAADENADEPSRKKGILTQNLNINSTVFVGSEMGEIALVDWLRNKEGTVVSDYGSKILTNVYMQTYHHGTITCLRRSPFYQDLILVVGGGTISIWKETCPFPIFLSGGLDLFPWCAIWSNSRPAVFYVGNREGSVSIWDLMDRSNGPVITQSVTNVSITDIGLPKIAASASKNQYLAVTDSEGVLMVLLLPRFYARPLPNEEHAIIELMSREDNRMNSWDKEHESRAEKIHSVNYNWQQSRILKTAEEINREEIDQEHLLNEEYVEFVEFEQSIVDDLKRGEPELPTMDTKTDEFDALIAEAQEKEDSGEEEEEAEDEQPPEFDDYGDFDDDDDDDDNTT